MESVAAQLIADLEASGQRHQVQYQGRQMTWRRFGAGSPFVLLHGGHGSWRHWARNIESLAASRTVWVPDMPGYGDSDSLDRNAGLAGLLSAMHSMLDDLFGKHGQIDLAGFSFGGFIASNIAVQRASVRSLVTVGCGGHGGPRRETQELINWRKSKTALEVDAAMRHNLKAHMLSDPAKLDELALEIHRWSCRHTRFRSKEISRSGRLSEVLSQRELPVMMLWGSNDVTAVPEMLLPRLLDGHPLRQGQILDGGGHWVQYECFAQVNHLLEQWCAHVSHAAPSESYSC